MNKDETGQNRNIVDYLSRRPRSDFNSFVECLVEAHQASIVDAYLCPGRAPPVPSKQCEYYSVCSKGSSYSSTEVTPVPSEASILQRHPPSRRPISKWPFMHSTHWHHFLVSWSWHFERCIRKTVPQHQPTALAAPVQDELWQGIHQASSSSHWSVTYKGGPGKVSLHSIQNISHITRSSLQSSCCDCS